MTGSPIVTVFRSRLRSGIADEYRPVLDRMLQLAHGMPGFVEIKTFAADDGERVSIVTFDSHETHRAWRDHPEHREAQRQGRERFYEEYSVQVCEVVSERRFSGRT